MITIGKATSAEYYTSGAGGASGVESYYLDAVTDGEPPGRWLGRGAAILGLAGEIRAEDMHGLYRDFVHPHTDEQLGRRPARFAATEDRIARAQAAEPDALPERLDEILRSVERTDRRHTIGWDATFAVPKSVTVVHTAAQRAEIAAIRSGDTGAADRIRAIRIGIEDAIAEANDAGIAVLEDLATSRVGGGSGAPLQWVPAQGLTVASFFQHTNRSIDPHLHQHNVILNRVLCEDGQYRALDGQDLLAQRYAASAVADRVLMEGMARLGLDSALNADGTARELLVVPDAVRQEFSARRQQINAALVPHVEVFTDRYGREPTTAELAAIKTAVQRTTRAAKTHDHESVEEMVDRMQARIAAGTGHTLDGFAELVGVYTESGPIEGRDLSPAAIIAEAVAACAARSATWGRASLMSEIELRLPVLGTDAQQSREVLEAFTDAGLAGADVVQVTGVDDDPDYRSPSSVRYAAAGTLAAEAGLRRAAVERGGHALDPVSVKEWLAEHAPALGADQRAVIEGLASSPARLAVLVGPAGSGKSYTTGVLTDVWTHTSDGGRVIGLATSGIATQVLRDDGIADSANVAAFLTAQRRLDQVTADDATGVARPDPFGDARWRLGPRDIVLVDEASMVATADLDAIRERVEHAGARMVLAGDPRQLAAVEAGGALGLLDGHAETYTLTDIRRFTEPWERAASLALRGGDPEALVDYDRHGRLLDADTVDVAITAAVRGAVADRLTGQTTVVVAATNDLAAQISPQVRDHLIALGHVRADGGVTLGRDANTASIGDQIMCRRNDHTLGVTNRAQYTVTGITETGDLLVQAGPDRDGTGPDQSTPDPITLPAGYVGEHVQLAYAGTVHAAQGITVDLESVRVLCRSVVSRRG